MNRFFKNMSEIKTCKYILEKIYDISYDAEMDKAIIETCMEKFKIEQSLSELEEITFKYLMNKL